MKKLIRVLPFVATVWVAMYVSKETGEIGWQSDYTVEWDNKEKRYKPRLPTYWQTKQKCMKAASVSAADGDYLLPWNTERKHMKTKDYKPVCYRLTKYSTR